MKFVGGNKLSYEEILHNLNIFDMHTIFQISNKKVNDVLLHFMFNNRLGTGTRHSVFYINRTCQHFIHHEEI